MKTKLLRRIRRYYEWRFLKNGNLLIRSRFSNYVREFSSVYSFIGFLTWDRDLIPWSLRIKHSKRIEDIENKKKWETAQ